MKSGLVTYPPSPLPLEEFGEGKGELREGAKPPLKFSSPSPGRRGGYRGVRLINNLYSGVDRLIFVMIDFTVVQSRGRSVTMFTSSYRLRKTDFTFTGRT